jgi:long-chain fatty acid transport protein
MTRAKSIAAMACGLALGLAFGQTTAMAGGYDTGERDWDALFITSHTVAVETQARHFMPDRDLSNVAASDTAISGNLLASTTGTATAPEAEAFTIFRASATGRAGDHLRCMASFRQPWEGHANYGTGFIASAAAIEQHFSSEDYGLTCAGTHHLDTGQVSLVGGVSYQHARYELTQSVLNTGVAPPFPVIGVATTDVDDWSWAWRVGLAYEIPAYALRASLIYNSQVDFDMEGSFSSVPGTAAIQGAISMPQSLELEVQSGVAPGWLAFGSIRWTDWSVATAMPLVNAQTIPGAFLGVGGTLAPGTAQLSGLQLQWNDSWTATAGGVHQVNDQLSLTGSLTWDQGATNGFTSQTDTWIGAFNAVYNPTEQAQIVVGGSAGLMTSGSVSTQTRQSGAANPLGYTATFGNDWVFALSAALKISF